MFSFFPPPFYFLAEELILIVALQQTPSEPGAALSAATKRAGLQDWVQPIAPGTF